MIYTNGEVVCIDEIVIDKDFRKKGFGKALISEFESLGQATIGKICSSVFKKG